MSGHSKWSKIKRKKAANDGKRSKMMSKMIRELTVAARDGGGDPDTNPRLRTAVSNSRAENITNDTIDRASGCLVANRARSRCALSPRSPWSARSKNAARFGTRGTSSSRISVVGRSTRLTVSIG